MTPWRIALTLALAAFILWRNLPGSLWCLWPGLVRIRRAPGPSAEDEAGDEAAFDAMEQDLAPLGFQRLGVHLEKPPLRRATRVYDFVSPAEATFASAVLERGGGRLYLLTPFTGGAFVLTADHRRPGTEKPSRYLGGGLPGASPEQVLAAHRRRVERMREAGLVAGADLSFDGRIRAGEQWFQGVGRREIRLAHANALILGLM